MRPRGRAESLDEPCTLFCKVCLANSGNTGADRGHNTKKCDFFEKSRKNIWWICEKALPLHSQTRNEGCLREKASTLVARESFKNGALVQLVRIHACHAWGHGFESRTHRFSLWFGSLAQLNRASDYGSEGCRFESCMSHHNEKGNGFATIAFFRIPHPTQKHRKTHYKNGAPVTRPIGDRQGQANTLHEKRTAPMIAQSFCDMVAFEPLLLSGRGSPKAPGYSSRFFYLPFLSPQSDSPSLS